MNRREFLKMAMAAAAAAHIPDFTEAEAAAAYDACGIADMGGGWYRCWFSYDKSTASSYLKASTHRWAAMSAGRIRVYFDLVKGEIGKVEVAEPGDLQIHSGGALVFAPQIEEHPEVVYTRTKA